MGSSSSDDSDDRRRRKKHRRREKDEDNDAASDEEVDRSRRRRRKHDKDSESEEDESSDDDEEEDRRHKKRKKDRKRKRDKKKKKHKKKRRKRSSSSSSEDEKSESSSDDDGGKDDFAAPNARLLAKLKARGETLEERKQRRAERAVQKRAAQIASITGYTAEDNPFHDPNLHQPFTWRKKEQKDPPKAQESAAPGKKKEKSDEKTLHEIEKLRRRREERELQMEEMERIKREEARMKELENFDDWARKEEAFHLQQQRQRSAIRLVQGREMPIDVLAKNLLLFGLSEEEKSLRGAAVKYQEKNNALSDLENLQAELEEPFTILQKLKLEELQEVLKEINAFLSLERQVLDRDSFETSTAMHYWEALRLVTLDEIAIIKTGGAEGSHATQAKDIAKIFVGQSTADLRQMQNEIRSKLSGTDASVDKAYWKAVQDQLAVHLAKNELSYMHQKMLVRQLEKLEAKREELAQKKRDGTLDQEEPPAAAGQGDTSIIPSNAVGDEGDLEEELGLTNEVDTKAPDAYGWADKYRPRKPRYFNRVKTGYDWNKYNKTHFDKDNPPPKTVQGYKFNVFYPDLIDPSKTPQFSLEAADSPEFCIIRFKAGPPYEDVAFKIVNREWNKSRKHGFRCTFERGILSLFFNFKTHWFRR